MCQQVNSPLPSSMAEVLIGEGPIDLEQVVAVASQGVRVVLSGESSFLKRLADSRDVLEAALENGNPVYGVTTGFGGSCGNQVDNDFSKRLGRNLIEYHGCGVGQPLGVFESRATVLCRLVSLARGYSGVSDELLKALADLLNHGISPVIPCQGSVGASGDLTPLSYVAACLLGERDAFYKGELVSARHALEAEGLKPYAFEPKEPLALINGTSVMTGIAVMAIARSSRILDAATKATGLAVHGLAGHAHHFHPGIFEAKPHSGQAQVATALRALLESKGEVSENEEPDWLQDPYSCRCSPHVLGVLADALKWIREWVEVEINSASDNPLADPDSGRVLMGGNFYGGHIAFAMDGLKTSLASVADMLDRQIALMVDKRFNRGLPANLVENQQAELHHGFKGLQITASALTAEANKASMPAAVFSRSTESHNQDKVSLGTIAARDALTICAMVEQVAAVHLLVSTQAAELRGAIDNRPKLRDVASLVRQHSETVVEDRRLDGDVQRLADAIARGETLEPSLEWNSLVDTQ